MNSNKIFLIVLFLSIPISLLASYLIFKFFGKDIQPSILGMCVILTYILYSVLFTEDENS